MAVPEARLSSNVIGEAQVRITPQTSGFEASVRRQVGGAFRTAATVAGGALLAGGAVRVVSDLIGDAGQLQKSLRESVGLLGETGAAGERTFRRFSADVRTLSRELGIAQEELSTGLYEALGAGVPRGNVVDFLRVATRASIAGVTDLETAVDGITTVMNAYGDEAGTAQEISDSFFQTVNAGKVRFDELASSLFNVAPIAAEAGVSLEEVGAAIATLTAGGVPGSVATTQLRQAIQSLVAPSVRAEKLLAPVFRDAGFESGQAALKALGLQRTLQLVRDAAGGSSSRLQRLVGSVEGLNAILTLTGKGSALFTEELDNQANAAGVTERALAQIERSAARSFQRAGNAVRNFGLVLGDAAAPAVARVADGIEDGLNDLSARPGFRRGVQGIADGIADALTDPQTIATLETFGTTAVDVMGAVRDASAAAAPAVQTLASTVGAVASSPLGPGLLLTAAAYSALGRGATFATGRIAAFRTAQAASTAAAVGQRAALAQTVTAVGLVGPSTARAATAATAGATAMGRLATFSRAAGAGLVALSGGPVTAAVVGVSALAAGAFLLGNRESFAEGQARRFNDALIAQATAANAAAEALERQRAAATSITQGRVNVDAAREAVGTARQERDRVEAAPASDFGGEAAKRDALAAATQRLRLAEQQLNDARRSSAQTVRTAIGESNRVQREAATATAQAAAKVRESGASAQTFGVALRFSREAAVRYSAAVKEQAGAQAQQSRRLAESAAVSRRAAANVDVSTNAGKRYAAQLRAEAQESARAATAQRTAAAATAQRALTANRAIASSKSATNEERAAARERVATLEKLVGQLRQAGRNGGQATAEGTAQGARSKKGDVQRAGTETGEAGVEGVTTTAEAWAAAGTNLGVGLVQGIDAQIPAAFAAGARLGAAGAEGARSARGADEGSPSRKTRETGRNLGRGLQAGMAAEQSRTSSGAVRLVAASIAAAGQAGVRNARTQGARIVGATAEGFRIQGGGFRATISSAVSAALRDSIVAARSNLEGFGGQLADLAGRAIDAGARSFSPERAALSARTGALDAARAADEERRLRNAVSLAEAGGDQARRRYEAAQAAVARRTPEQDARMSPLARERERQRLEELRLAAEDPARSARLELESFLAQQDEQRLSAQEAAAQAETQARREALSQQLADLVSNLNEQRISLADFNAGVNATLAANGVNLAAIGGQLGQAFVDSFNATVGQVRGQAGINARAPRLPAGFVPGLEDPSNVALQEAVTARNQLRQAFSSEFERTRQTQNAQLARLRQTFETESSAGGRRIVASEQRQLEARATEHKQTLRELKSMNANFLRTPPPLVIESIVVSAPGADAQAIGAAIAREMSRRTAQRARR